MDVQLGPPIAVGHVAWVTVSGTHAAALAPGGALRLWSAPWGKTHLPYPHFLSTYRVPSFLPPSPTPQSSCLSLADERARAFHTRGAQKRRTRILSASPLISHPRRVSSASHSFCCGCLGTSRFERREGLTHFEIHGIHAGTTRACSLTSHHRRELLLIMYLRARLHHLVGPPTRTQHRPLCIARASSARLPSPHY